MNQTKNLIDFLLVAGGKFSAAAVAFVGGLMIARCAGPEEFGIYSVAISLVLIGDGLIGAPLDMSAVRFTALHPGEPERTQRFEAMALHLKLLAIAAVGSIVLGLGFIFRQFLPELDRKSFPLTTCLFATGCLLVVRSAATGLQIRHRFRVYSALELAQGLLRLAGFGVLVALGRVKAALWICVYGGVALGTALTSILLLGQRYLLGKWLARPDVLRMLGYSGYATATAVLGILTGRGDLLILASVRGASEVAAYGLASQMSTLFAQGAWYATVLTQPRIIPMAREGRLRHLFAQNLGVVALMAAVAVFFLHPGFLHWAITGVFKEGFAETVPLLRIMMAGALLDYLGVPVLMVFGIQVCPRQAFLGESAISFGFLALTLAAISGRGPFTPEQNMACVTVVTRLTKVLLYASLFWIHTAKTASHSGTLQHTKESYG